SSMLDQNPQILYRGDQPALDFLPPQTTPPGPLGPVIVAGVSKTALHHVLPTLAAAPCRRALGLLQQGGNSLRLHMAPDRTAVLGLRALRTQRAMATQGRIVNLVNFQLLLRPMLVEHQIMTRRTPQSVQGRFIDKLRRWKFTPLLHIGTDVGQMGS